MRNSHLWTGEDYMPPEVLEHVQRMNELYDFSAGALIGHEVPALQGPDLAYAKNPDYLYELAKAHSRRPTAFAELERTAGFGQSVLSGGRSTARTGSSVLAGVVQTIGALILDPVLIGLSPDRSGRTDRVDAYVIAAWR